MSQILNNLTLNAIQAMDEGNKELFVELLQKDSKLMYSIRDTGRGISDELKDKIFKPYFSTKEKGSGIGLALAKKGIEQAGGNIWFESAEGEGTTFFFTLPVDDPDRTGKYKSAARPV